MFLTVAQAREIIYSHIHGGIPASDPRVLEALNNISAQLLAECDPADSIVGLRLYTRDNTVSMPFGISAPRVANIGGEPVRIQTEAYEFIEGGPGGYSSDARGVMIPRNSAPTQYTIPQDKAYKLIAYSNVQTDDGKEITVQGYSDDYPVVGTAPDMTITIGIWDGSVGTPLSPAPLSDFTVTYINHLVLPSSIDGFVRLYAVDPDNIEEGAVAFDDMIFLSQYRPGENMVPSYKRYQVPGLTENVTEDPNYGWPVDVICKRAHIPLVSDDDIVQIPNIAALKTMAIAMDRLESGRVQEAQVYKEQAIQMIGTQREQEDVGQQITYQNDSLYSSSGGPDVL